MLFTAVGMEAHTGSFSAKCRSLMFTDTQYCSPGITSRTTVSNPLVFLENYKHTNTTESQLLYTIDYNLSWEFIFSACSYIIIHRLYTILRCQWTKLIFYWYIINYYNRVAQNFSACNLLLSQNYRPSLQMINIYCVYFI